MDISNLLKMGASAFMNSQQSGEAGSGLNIETLTSALSGLVSKDGNFDITSLLANLQGGGLASMAQSWLGDGENQPINASQISDMFGSDKISAFASQLGLSETDAVGGLQDAIPQMIDKVSSGGSLLDSVGGLSGALGMAGKLFGK